MKNKQGGTVAQHEGHLTHSWGVREIFVVDIISNESLKKQLKATQ